MGPDEIRAGFVFLTFFVGIGVGLAIGFCIARACHKCQAADITPKQEARFASLFKKLDQIQ